MPTGVLSVGEGVRVAVGEGVGVSVSDGVAVGVTVAVSLGVLVGVGVQEAQGVGVLVGVKVLPDASTFFPPGSSVPAVGGGPQGGSVLVGEAVGVVVAVK